MRKILVSGIVAAGLVVGAVGGVGAFEPPHDPQNKFTCTPNTRDGHPGIKGVGAGSPATDQGSVGPWNATTDFGGPLESCQI